MAGRKDKQEKEKKRKRKEKKKGKRKEKRKEKSKQDREWIAIEDGNIELGDKTKQPAKPILLPHVLVSSSSRHVVAVSIA